MPRDAKPEPFDNPSDFSTYFFLLARAFSKTIASVILETLNIALCAARNHVAMMDSATPLSRLLHDARQDCPQALEQLLESFRTYLRLLARTGIEASLRGKADPSDLVQETLFKAHRSFGQFQGQTEGELAGWLRRILANSLNDFARSYQMNGARQVCRERSLDAILEDSSAALLGLLVRGGPSPSESAQRREMGLVLADALAELNDDYREVLVLRSLEERDWEETARCLGRTVGATRMLWARALKALRPLLEKRL
jgi:RNA polymerase sigma-70 factor (ECF subfamily)